MRIERQNENYYALNAQGAQQTASAQPAQTAQAAQQTGAVNTVQDGFVSSPKSESVTYQPPKKLTEEQVQELKNQMKQSMIELAKTMLGGQDKIARLADGSVDYAKLADQLGIGKTPEEAQAAISEDGMWGVDAVATRLMDMAMALSGGDPSKAELLRDAVQKGFAAVGDLDSLPQVCQDTYTETIKRFDYWVEKGSLDGYGQAEETEQEEA